MILFVIFIIMATLDIAALDAVKKAEILYRIIKSERETMIQDDIVRT